MEAIKTFTAEDLRVFEQYCAYVRKAYANSTVAHLVPDLDELVEQFVKAKKAIKP